MANTDVVNGAKLVGHLYGATPQIREYVVPAADGTALFVGDFVKTYGTADATTGMSTVIQAAAGDTLRGVVVGFKPIDTAQSLTLESLYRPVSVRQVVYVCDDPNAIFEIQEDAVGATVALIDIGENADIIVAAGNTTSGASGMELDSSDHKTATAQLRMLGFVRRADNTPASANAKLLVMINEHELKSTTGV